MKQNQDELNDNLTNINNILKKLQKNLSSTLLEPSHLDWTSFLENIEEICDHYSKISKNIPEELKNKLMFLTRSEILHKGSSIESISNQLYSEETIEEIEEISRDFDEFINTYKLNGKNEEEISQCLDAIYDDFNGICDYSAHNADNYIKILDTDTLDGLSDMKSTDTNPDFVRSMEVFKKYIN